MSCKDIMRRLMDNPADTSVGIGAHLEECAHCRQLKDALTGLARAGADARARDLAGERVSSTRLLVAEILARRRDEPGGFPFWTPARATAWTLPVFGVVILGLILFLGKEREGAPPGGVSPEIARLDARIEALSGGLERAIAEFQRERLVAEPIPLENRANELMVDMELCARRPAEELACLAVALPRNGRRAR
ncbi:MAG: hypothetical protein QME60_01855 [Verrucomicrobiota bacterium]|nr:hypothetical protein [Verrucomicrobiota bacterium]